MSDAALTVLSIAALAVGLLGSAYATWRRFHPTVERASAAIDALVGKPPVIDRSGNIMEPALPGLVHRVATVEEAVVEFRHLVGIVTEALGRVDALDARVSKLEDIRVEKLLGQAESVHMWRAVADRDVLDAED